MVMRDEGMEYLDTALLLPRRRRIEREAAAEW